MPPPDNVSQDDGPANPVDGPIPPQVAENESTIIMDAESSSFVQPDPPVITLQNKSSHVGGGAKRATASTSNVMMVGSHASHILELKQEVATVQSKLDILLTQSQSKVRTEPTDRQPSSSAAYPDEIKQRELLLNLSKTVDELLSIEYTVR